MNESTKAAKWVGYLGLLFYSGPAWGLIGTIIGMMRAFDRLEEAGESSPHQLAAEISIAILSTAIGLVAGLIGLILILIARYALKFGSRAFFSSCVTLSVMWCIFPFPYGAIVGLPMLVVLICQRDNYMGRSAEPTE